MREGYARQYADLYRRHWWWRSRERFLRRILEDLELGADLGPVLDVGCGDGLFFPVLSRWGVPEGVEADQGLVTAAGLARGAIHRGPFDQSFQPGKRYRLITALDVLEHAPDEGAFLARARELLTEDGILVLTVPALPWLWTHHDDLNLHRTRYTARSLMDAVGAAGLHGRASYFFGWTVPVKLLVRLKEGILGPGGDEVRVPPGTINRFLEVVSAVEHGLTPKAGLPLGSSLLAVLSPSVLT